MPKACLSGAMLAVVFGLFAPVPGRAQNPNSTALAGQITSKEEGSMEGVLVNAKGAGSNITISVVSDDKGRYSFPRAKLKPGQYTLSVRAVGYEISSPATIQTVPKQAPQLAPDKHIAPLRVPVEVPSNKTAQLDLKLTKIADISSQLSKAEWLLSFPGTDKQKRSVTGCGDCHSWERIVRSKYDAAGFLAVMKRMESYDNGSTPLRPVKSPPSVVPIGRQDPVTQEALKKATEERAQFLSSVNLSSGSTWKYPLKTLPRPQGEATKVVYTEYDLPRPESEPHDAAVDSEGMVWYSDFGSLFLGRLDPRTGATKEWRIPEVKQGVPASGTLSIYFDKQGNVWVGSLFQAAVYRFDKKTEKFTSWSAPKEYNNRDSRNSMTAPDHSDVDGKVWFGNALANKVIHRIDMPTGNVETFSPYGEKKVGHSIYCVVSDTANNVVFCDYQGSGIGEINAKTGKIDLYPTPTPNAWPRRGNFDSQGNFWFGENQANRVGMFDPKTKQIREWLMPTRGTDPYDVMADKNRDVWTSGMTTDRVVRLNPKTGRSVEYLLPRPTQTRRVFVDSSTTPVAFWVGSNLGASIVKVEPTE